MSKIISHKNMTYVKMSTEDHPPKGTRLATGEVPLPENVQDHLTTASNKAVKANQLVVQGVDALTKHGMPGSYDPRKDVTVQNILTPILNQQSCGCCWAMSAADIITLIFRIRAVRLGIKIPAGITADPLFLMSCVPALPGPTHNPLCQCCGGNTISAFLYSCINPLQGFPSGKGAPSVYGAPSDVVGYLTLVIKPDANPHQAGGAMTSKCMDFDSWCPTRQSCGQSPGEPGSSTDPHSCECISNCISTSKEYPVVGKSGQKERAVCGSGQPQWYYRFFTQNPKMVQFSGGGYTLPQWRNLVCEQILQYGAVGISINCYQEFQDYGNPYNPNSPPFTVGLNGQFIGGHAILACGWKSYLGPDNSVKFAWLVKNSWGDWWGDKGYVYIESSETNFGGIECNAPPGGQPPAVNMIEPSLLALQTVTGKAGSLTASDKALEIADLSTGTMKVYPKNGKSVVLPPSQHFNPPVTPIRQGPIAPAIGLLPSQPAHDSWWSDLPVYKRVLIILAFIAAIVLIVDLVVGFTKKRNFRK